MPRNGSGTYSLPASYQATTGETITALQHNLPLTDIAADLNAARPIASGGTGAATASGARSNLGLAIGSDVAAYSDRVPSGIIAMWSGTIATIPTGWNLCDGTNSTPDLTGMFIVGAGDAYTVGDMGGAETVTLTEAELPSHTHDKGTLATTSAGNHSHTYTKAGSSATGTAGGGPDDDIEFTTANTSTAGAHTHPMSGDTGSTGSGDAHENRPPYYALAFIMKA